MIKFFVQKKSAIFTMVIMILIMGTRSYFDLPRESAPEIKQPYIFVNTVYPGVGAKDIENLVTRVIEDELDGIEGLKKVSSSSQQSLSFISVEFTSDVDVETALRRVRERVDIAKSQLPKDAKEPSVRELSSSSFPIFILVLSHPDGLKIIDKSADLIEDELKKVHGVLDVKVAGKLKKEVAIELDPIKMDKYDLTINKVIQAIQTENKSIPGGILKSNAKVYSISVTGEIKDPLIFENIMIRDKGKEIPLSAVGTAKFTWAEPETYSRLNGNSCITISLTKRSGQNIISIVDNAKKSIEKLKQKLPEGTKLEYFFDESTTIKDMVADLENNMITGFLLVLFVTILFLGKTNSLFVSLAIPLSMLVSFTVLEIMGITLNMVVLFSLILSLGMLVDNGIVIVENIFRHGTMGKSRVQAAIDGSKEVAGPIITSTLTTCLAFFPIIFMPDVMGDFMSFIPKTVIIVLTSSLFVAIVINPVFCANFLKISKKNIDAMTGETGRYQGVQSRYFKIVKGAIKQPFKVTGISFIIVILGMILYGAFGKEPKFFPAGDPSDAIISLECAQGTPLDSTNTFIEKVEKIVKKSPAPLKNFNAVAGREGGGNRFAGKGNSEYHKGYVRVGYKSFLERRDTTGRMAVDTLKERLANFVGAGIKVEELEHGPPTGHPISYKIVGDDYEIMGKYTDSIITILNAIPELKLVDTDFEPARPELSIEINRNKASFFGLSTAEIAGTIRNAINGAEIGKFRQGENEYDINIRYKTDYRNSLNKLSNLHIVSHDKHRIPLSSIASIQRKSSVGVIRRIDFQRAIEVWADFKGSVQNKKELKNKIDNIVKNLKMPQGYEITDGEGGRMRSDASKFLVKAFIVAIFLMFIVLVIQFNSILDPFIILISVFLSIGGVMWGYFLSGQTFIIIMSGIGCISLAGVAVNNCIVLIDYTNILIKNGRNYLDAIAEAGKTRLRPVLLTAITTVLGLLPMALGLSFDFHNFVFQFASESGEFWKAFAWAMIFGLSFATIMTLVVVPCLLAIKFRFFPPQIPKDK